MPKTLMKMKCCLRDMGREMPENSELFDKKVLKDNFLRQGLFSSWRSMEKMTQLKAFKGKKLNLSQPRMVGAKAFVLLPNEMRSATFSVGPTPDISVGYIHGSSYRYGWCSREERRRKVS